SRHRVPLVLVAHFTTHRFYRHYASETLQYHTSSPGCDETCAGDLERRRRRIRLWRGVPLAMADSFRRREPDSRRGLESHTWRAAQRSKACHPCQMIPLRESGRGCRRRLSRRICVACCCAAGLAAPACCWSCLGGLASR